MIEQYAGKARERFPRAPEEQESEESLLEIIDLYSVEEGINAIDKQKKVDMLEACKGRVPCTLQVATADYSKGAHTGREPLWAVKPEEGLENLIERYNEEPKTLSREETSSLTSAWGRGEKAGHFQRDERGS